jgi:hypothetical protein
MLVANIATTGHQAREMSPDYLLERKNRNKKIKNNKTRLG